MNNISPGLDFRIIIKLGPKAKEINFLQELASFKASVVMSDSRRNNLLVG